nr:MAG TPA: hypothetical protein [Caudoviricetes sp.]
MNAIQFFQWGNSSDAYLLEKIFTELNSKDSAKIVNEIRISAFYDDMGYSALLDGITCEKKNGKIKEIIIKFNFLNVIGEGMSIFFKFYEVPFFFSHLEQTRWLFEDKEIEVLRKENTEYYSFPVEGNAKVSKLYKKKETVTLKIVKK